ncbi:MAG: stage II sporulation protein M [Paraclostridium sp.]
MSFFYIQGVTRMKNYTKLFICSFIIFFIGLLLGILFSFSLNLPQQPIQNEIIPDPSIYMAIKFLKHNGLVALMLYIGLFTFAVSTIIVLISNGFNLGFFIGIHYSLNRPLNQLWISILPHGIFEILGFLIAATIGLEGIRFYFIKNKTKNIKTYLILFLISISCIFIAALIEGYLTPFLLKNYI